MNDNHHPVVMLRQKVPIDGGPCSIWPVFKGQDGSKVFEIVGVEMERVFKTI